MKNMQLRLLSLIVFYTDRKRATTWLRYIESSQVLQQAAKSLDDTIVDMLIAISPFHIHLSLSTRYNLPSSSKSYSQF